MRELFSKYNQRELFEQIRLRLLVVKDLFKDEEEFNHIIEETLLIAYQEERILNDNSFFILFEKVQEDIRRDEELEFQADKTFTN